VSAQAVRLRRIEAAIGTLGDLTQEDHDELDGSTRDEFSHVIHVLEQIAERKAANR
jgi:hypothetical protein